MCRLLMMMLTARHALGLFLRDEQQPPTPAQPLQQLNLSGVLLHLLHVHEGKRMFGFFDAISEKMKVVLAISRVKSLAPFEATSWTIMCQKSGLVLKGV